MIDRWVSRGVMVSDSGIIRGPWSGSDRVRTKYNREWVLYKDYCNEVAMLRREIKRLNAILERNDNGQA